MYINSVIVCAQFFFTHVLILPPAIVCRSLKSLEGKSRRLVRPIGLAIYLIQGWHNFLQF